MPDTVGFGPFQYAGLIRPPGDDNDRYDYALPGDAFEESARWWRATFPELVERVADPSHKWPHHRVLNTRNTPGRKG